MELAPRDQFASLFSRPRIDVRNVLLPADNDDQCNVIHGKQSNFGNFSSIRKRSSIREPGNMDQTATIQRGRHRVLGWRWRWRWHVWRRRRRRGLCPSVAPRAIGTGSTNSYCWCFGGSRSSREPVERWNALYRIWGWSGCNWTSRGWRERRFYGRGRNPRVRRCWNCPGWRWR